MSFVSVIAQLADKLTMAEIKKLTLYQIAHVYMHPRDEKTGDILHRWEVQAAPPSYEEEFRAVWRARGLGPALVELKWRRFLEEEGLQDQWARQGKTPDEIKQALRQYRSDHPLLEW